MCVSARSVEPPMGGISSSEKDGKRVGVAQSFIKEYYLIVCGEKMPRRSRPIKGRKKIKNRNFYIDGSTSSKKSSSKRANELRKKGFYVRTTKGTGKKNKKIYTTWKSMPYKGDKRAP